MRPRQVRYQAALRPDICTSLILSYFLRLCNVSCRGRGKTVTKRATKLKVRDKTPTLIV